LYTVCERVAYPVAKRTPDEPYRTACGTPIGLDRAMNKVAPEQAEKVQTAYLIEAEKLADEKESQ
jgi:hypothetical protein